MFTLNQQTFKLPQDSEVFISAIWFIIQNLVDSQTPKTFIFPFSSSALLKIMNVLQLHKIYLGFHVSNSVQDQFFSYWGRKPCKVCRYLKECKFNFSLHVLNFQSNSVVSFRTYSRLWGNWYSCIWRETYRHIHRHTKHTHTLIHPPEILRGNQRRYSRVLAPPQPYTHKRKKAVSEGSISTALTRLRYWGRQQKAMCMLPGVGVGRGCTNARNLQDSENERH